MRYCVRVFEETRPTEETIREILDYARYAACSKNMQPWKVFVLQGESLKELAVDMVGALTEKRHISLLDQMSVNHPLSIGNVLVTVASLFLS